MNWKQKLNWKQKRQRAKFARYALAYGLKPEDLRGYHPVGGHGKLKRANKRRRMQEARVNIRTILLPIFDPPREF